MIIYRHRATIKPKRKDANTMKLTLEKTRTVEDRKYELYTIGKYQIEVTNYSNGNRYITIRVDRFTNRFIPEIYCKDNFEGKILGFEIQTTSYGALNAEAIQKVIAGYNEALEVVEILTKEFVNA